MNTLKDKKQDAESLAVLLMGLSPRERESIRQGIIIGKTIFKSGNKNNKKAG